MKIEMDQLLALAWQAGGLILTLAVGLLCFQVGRRGLERLFASGLVNQAFFLIAKNILRWLLIIVVAVAILQQLGVKVSNIVTALLTVAGMIAIGFIAVWSVLSNILCAMMLIIFRNFDMGDEIEIIEPVGGPGLRGRVVGFNLMFTILAESGEGVDAAMRTQVPNNIFFQKTLRRRPGRITEGLGQYLLARTRHGDEIRADEGR
jgi:small-conductance mechanosensitive channel